MKMIVGKISLMTLALLLLTGAPRMAHAISLDIGAAAPAQTPGKTSGKTACRCDNNPCTKDACDAAGKCTGTTPVATGTPCSVGTTPGSCRSGQCVASETPAKETPQRSPQPSQTVQPHGDQGRAEAKRHRGREKHGRHKSRSFSRRLERIIRQGPAELAPGP